MNQIDAIRAIPALVRELGAGDDYVLIGSCNLFLQGIDVVPRDIDILTTPEGIGALDGVLAPYRTKGIYFDTSEGRNSFRSFYDYQGVEVEILGSVDNAYRAKDALRHKLMVNRDGVEIPCLALQQELDAYRKMGRADKVTLLEDWLGRHEE